MDRKRKLALAFTEAKAALSALSDNKKSISRLEDIMLASIRTLSFLWDTGTDKNLDYLVDQIIRQMAQIVAIELNLDEDAVYMELLRKTV